MPLTIRNCTVKLMFHRFKRLLAMTVLGSFLAAIPGRLAQAGDNAAQTNYGGRKLLLRVEPAYPADLKTIGVGGYVHLTITIAPNGTVVSSEVIGGNPILVQEAAKAVAKWKFSPATSSTTVEVWFHFAR